MFLDLHYVGSKSHWSTFDKARVTIYMRTGIAVAYIFPNFKPFSMIHNVAVLGNAYLNKRLPDIDAIDLARDMLLSTKGNPRKTKDSFNDKLMNHESRAIKNYKLTGATRYVNEISQYVSFYSYGMPFYDVWKVLICTDIVNGKPKTSYLVWGMGVTTDKNAPIFFGNQVGGVGKLIPLRWFNCLEREGLAKGYWSLLTETNETSKFSYEARYLKPAQRKQIWLNEMIIYHKKGFGQWLENHQNN